MNKINPYYKEYKKRSPLVQKPNYTFKLPEEVKEDFDEYLKAFPNLNKAMLELIIEILNSKCTERKYYNIDVVSILPYDFEEERINKGLYLSSKDNYLIGNDGLIVNSSSIILNNDIYLNPSKMIDTEDFSNMLNNGYFTYSGIEPIDFIYLNECIHEYYLSNDFNFIYGYSLVYFKINNFLDEFIDNEYKTANNTHKGIGYYISDYKVLYFYVYDWKFDEESNFELLDIGLVSENEFKALILNSSNDELKQFLKGFKDLGSYEEAISDVPEDSQIEELMKENMELRKQLDILEEFNETLQEENESLKLNKVDLFKEGYDKGKDETEESIKNRFREILKENKEVEKLL